MMKLITIKSQILEVVDNWYKSYAGFLRGSDKDEIYKKLKKLDLQTATAEEVADIIGNPSWACKQKCTECNDYSNEVIELGEKPDWESATTWICKKCLRKAVTLINKNNKTEGEGENEQ